MNREPDGVMHYTNTIGLAVWFDGDGLIVADYINDVGYKGFRHHRICYSPSGRTFFWHGGHRIYLDNIMRT